MKYFNVRNVVILLIVFLCLHLGVGFFVSPFVSRIAVSALNRHAKVKITLEDFRVWPLTLSFSMRGLSVFDPQDVSKRMVRIDNASARLGLFGLLSRRLVIASATIDGLDINVEGAPDGSFNINKIMQPVRQPDAAVPASLPEALEKNKDWFGRARRTLAQHFSKQKAAREKARKKEGVAIKREVKEFPRGRRVYFKKYHDRYLIEAGHLLIKNAVVHVRMSDGAALDLTGLTVRLSGAGIDPANGLRLARLTLEGAVSREGNSLGRVSVHFLRKTGNRVQETYEVTTRDLDLSALRFIYQESLPVDLKKGFLTLDSKTNFVDENIDSHNVIALRDHAFGSKAGVDLGGFLPPDVIFNALNDVNPLNLDFVITGTIDKPEFKGFQQSLAQVIAPSAKAIGEEFKKKGLSMVNDLLKQNTASSGSSGNETSSATIESFKSLFKKKNN